MIRPRTLSGEQPICFSFISMLCTRVAQMNSNFSERLLEINGIIPTSSVTSSLESSYTLIIDDVLDLFLCVESFHVHFVFLLLLLKHQALATLAE